MTSTPVSRDAVHLRELTPLQWKSGIAAWLGWLFDGLELHLYTLVATPLVMTLLMATSAADPAVKEKSAYIQAAFLLGWALGGAFFGRVGDRLGRSRALALTIITYALCTGLCAFAQTWWQLMIFRFVAALGIGGEWAVGASLLAETWPKAWRPWMAAVLQTGVNIGVLCGAVVVGLLSWVLPPGSERWVFLVGVLPALLVFWIRRHVPEPETWQRAGASSAPKPGALDLFRGSVRSVTLRTSAVCALGLSAWWLMLFWQTQHLRKLLVDAHTPAGETTQLVSAAFFAFNFASILGNFGAGWLALRVGNRRAISGCSSDSRWRFLAPSSCHGILPPWLGFGSRSADFSVGCLASLRCICRHFSRRCFAPRARDFATTLDVSRPRRRRLFSAYWSRSVISASRY